jgi:glycolate oxidase FAD binding subunit
MTSTSSDILAPHSAEGLAEALRAASERDRPVVPWGAGTLQHLGAAAPPGALALQTTALNRIVDYNPPDLTITVEAGATLGAIQETLQSHGQWLPWDPPAPMHATIGGLLAAGAAGPLRLGYGTPRDWTLGMRVALGDGRLVKSGGRVVKNVAGYEAHKLHIGALGTLGVILEVTLKVAPMPEQLGSLIAICPTRASAFALAAQLRERPLAPTSLILSGATSGGNIGGSVQVAIRFAGVAPAVARQLRAAAALAQASGASIVDMDDRASADLWRALATFSAPQAARGGADSLLIRAGARPSALPAVLDALEQRAPSEPDARFVGYAGVGLAYARWQLPAQPDPAAIVRAVAELRSALGAMGGYAVVEDPGSNLRAALDLWGPPPATLALMRALKAQWDPRGVLNRGRYLGL